MGMEARSSIMGTMLTSTIHRKFFKSALLPSKQTLLILTYAAGKSKIRDPGSRTEKEYDYGKRKNKDHRM